MRTLHIGMIGLGDRGRSLLEYAILPREEIEIAAICDVYQDRIDETNTIIAKQKDNRQAKGYTDANQLLDENKLDAIILSTAWDHHTQLACKAMELGIPVALEVGGAYSEHELWKLVDTYETTRTPFMFMENCCFGRTELMILNMVEKGVFGEVVHCAGGYKHDLRDEVSGGQQNRHYRLDNYLKRNTENYPTHEIGPIARVLKLNHGNRMLTLSAVASKTAGLAQYLEDHKEKYPELEGKQFRQGDIVTTTITCALGQTITLTLDTTLPRYYSRGFEIHGTKGMYLEDNDSIFLDKDEDHQKSHFSWYKHWGNAKNYRDEYEHPIWKKFLEDEIRGGHGGMDWLEFDAFFEALQNDTPMPIDVYDAASWMIITELAEKSIALGGQPQAFPDFTKGQWIHEN